MITTTSYEDPCLTNTFSALALDIVHDSEAGKSILFGIFLWEYLANVPDCRHSSTSHELFCEINRLDISPPPTLLQLLALDMFSNFLRALVLDNRAMFKENSSHEFPPKTFLGTIGEYLIENKVCHAGFALKLAIIPAILALDAQQENEPSQPKGDEIAI